MKCIVLAGGSGDRLWPISRKNFPKQFVEIKKNHSMFQESILRNMPFCDEFIIITNKKYENIARNQLDDFHNLKYSFILEEAPLKTAASLIYYALHADKNENVMILSVDNIIEGDYNKEIVKAIEQIDDEHIIALGAKPTNKQTGYHFFKTNKKGQVTFTTDYQRGVLWDLGIFICKISSLLKATDNHYLKLIEQGTLNDKIISFNNEKDVALRNNQVLNSEKFKVIKVNFIWKRIMDLSSLYEELKLNNSDSIIKESKNVEIINKNKKQKVVVNGLKNIVVSNTPDALLITSKKEEWNIKEIQKECENNPLFEVQPKHFESWGTYEKIYYFNHTQVGKISILPNKIFNNNYRLGYAYTYCLVDGSIEVTIDEKINSYSRNDSFTINAEFKSCEFKNISGTYAVILVTINPLHKDVVSIDDGFLVKMRPVLKDYIWGGYRINSVLNKDTTGFDTVAESWELSSHEAGKSSIYNGKYAGLSFDEYLKNIDKNNLGWKIETYDRFPLLIKFIDARSNLSIQVHPQDDYAFKYENDFGKNEMWYILATEPGAFIYVGFNKDVTRQEVNERISNNTILEVLNKVEVKPGESFYIKAGTVHAIGAGCLICEIQQSSNVTYRLYDYGRLDKNGLPRQLHIKQALEVLNYNKYDFDRNNFELISKKDYREQKIAECKYFTVTKYEIDGKLTLPLITSSFRAISVVSGSGKISNNSQTFDTFIGDTWFSLANQELFVEGKLTILVSQL